MRRTFVLACAVIACCPALARAQAPPCATGESATATLTAIDQYLEVGDPTLIATHRTLLDVEFGEDAAAATVDPESIRFSSTTPGLREEDGEATFVAADPGPVEIRVSWEQEIFSGDELRRCSGSVAKTFTFVAGRPLRIRLSGGHDTYGHYVRTRRGFTGAIINLSVDLIASRRSDFADVTIRWRARRRKAAFPTGGFQQAVLRPVVDDSGRRKRLGTAGRLRLDGEQFPFAFRDDDRNDVARISLGPFTRFSTGYYRGNGGYEVQVVQRGRRLVRVRGTLKKCHRFHGCQVKGRVMSAKPLVTFPEDRQS